jgi:hypothetical protein
MEMSFPGKAAREEARLDHELLLAALAAQRATSAAAKGDKAGPAMPVAEEPITEILLAGPGWRSARATQQGSFHRDEADRRP